MALEGYAAALYSASAGLRVGLIEQDRVGGTCLHRGCIPAKELLQTAEVYRTVAGAKDFGVEAAQPGINLEVSQQRKRRVIDRLTRGLESRVRSRAVTVVNGTGVVADAARRIVRVDTGIEMRGESLILAAGSVPRLLPGFEFDGERILSSDHVLLLHHVPHRVAVIRGGAIGCEFASLLRDLGSEVTVLEALPQILPGVDADIAEVVMRAFRKRGVKVTTGVTVTGRERSGDEVTVHYRDERGHQQLCADVVVVSVSRAKAALSGHRP